MTGKELFQMYVAVGLCVTYTYRWDDLAPALQYRWDRLAEQLTKKA